MNVIWTTIRRELMGYLFSPVGYLIAFLIYVARGLEVSALVRRSAVMGSDIEQFAVGYSSLATNWFMIVLVPPILTMRCFAEESRTGSLEVLLTAPVKFWEVVIGKWLAAFAFFVILWLPSLLIFWLLTSQSYLAADLPLTTVLSSSVGFALIAGLVLAAGVFASSLTDNVLLAVLVSMLFAAALVLGEYFLFPLLAPTLLHSPWLGSLVSQLKVVEQVSGWFSRGLIDSAQCVFYCAGIGFFLYLTMRSLELPRRAAAGARRWLGFVNFGVSAALALGIWLGLSVLGTRSAFRVLLDVSPQARFTFSPDTETLLTEMGKRGLTLEIDTFFEPLPAQTNNPDQNHVIGLRRRVQELTSDMVRFYDRRGGESVVLTQHDLLRGDLKAARERKESLSLGPQHRNSLVVKVGKRFKVLSLNFDLADIEFPATQRNPMPGAPPKKARLRGFRGEEAVSSAVRSLLVEGTPKAYFLAGYGGITIQSGVANSYSELASALADQGFEVGLWNLRKEGRLPDDAAVVALLEPIREFSKRDADTLFAYLRGGGRMLLNVSYREQPVDHNPTFDTFTRKLGFEIGDDLICHYIPDRRIPNSPGRAGPGVENLSTKLNPQHPITKPLARAGVFPVFRSARELRVPDDRPDGIHVDPSLAQTGPYAWIARRGRNGLVDRNRDPRERSSFASRPVGLLIDIDPEPGAERAGHLVVISGVAFINGAGVFRLNGDLALNIFNWMAERRELIAVRDSLIHRQRLEILAPQILRSERLLLRWVPGGLALLAVAMYFLRRRE